MKPYETYARKPVRRAGDPEVLLVKAYETYLPEPVRRTGEIMRCSS